MTIKEFFTKYYQVISNEDLNDLDQLFHADSPFLPSIKRQYESVRTQLEVNIDLESIELVSKQDDMLVVRDCMLFAGTKGETVNKQRSENVHVLTKKAEGEWKIHSTICLSLSGA